MFIGLLTVLVHIHTAHKIDGKIPRERERERDDSSIHTQYTDKALSGTTKRERNIYMADSNGAHKALVFFLCMLREICMWRWGVFMPARAIHINAKSF